MKEKNKTVYTTTIKGEEELAEMIYIPEIQQTKFYRLNEGRKIISGEVGFEDTSIKPFSANHQLVNKKVVLFPSGIEGYGSQKELIAELRSYIHKYLDISPQFELICAYYILLTYLYDKHRNIMYLRFMGDYGSGKSRALKVIGSVCNKPMMATGAATTSPIFRIIDQFKGTLVIDEADFSKSDTYADIVKIFNSGYEKDSFVWRSSGNNKGQFNPEVFDCYGPKIIATRHSFSDEALESRCFTEYMAQKQLREDIPLELPKDFDNETRVLRNKLLNYRLDNFYTERVSSKIPLNIEPRLKQLGSILYSIIDDEDSKSEFLSFMESFDEQLVNGRLNSLNGKIVKSIFECTGPDIGSLPTVKEIVSKYTTYMGFDDPELDPGSMGKKLRSELQIVTTRKAHGSVISSSMKSRLIVLYQKYGLIDESKVKGMKDMKVARDSNTYDAIIG